MHPARPSALTWRRLAARIRVMASPTVPPPVKLICGMLSARRELLDEAAAGLAEHFGPVDLASEVMDFDFTDYYRREMGGPLRRQFVSFTPLVPPEALVRAKRLSNSLEARFVERYGVEAGAGGVPLGGESRAGGTPPGGEGQAPVAARPINLDPGYVDSPKLVLASMKNFAHRIYLGDGVFAEVTLLHRRGQWTPLEWTFPDYASGRYWPFLDRVRRRLREQLGSETRS